MSQWVRSSQLEGTEAAGSKAWTELHSCSPPGPFFSSSPSFNCHTPFIILFSSTFLSPPSIPAQMHTRNNHTTITLHLAGRSISFKFILDSEPPKKRDLDLWAWIPPWPQNRPHFATHKDVNSSDGLPQLWHTHTHTRAEAEAEASAFIPMKQ